MNQYNIVAEIGMTSKLCVQMSMIAQKKKYQQIEQINLISLYYINKYKFQKYKNIHLMKMERNSRTKNCFH